MIYYTTAHKDDAKFLIGDVLDACTSHMVVDSGYDLASIRDIVASHPWKVAIEMERSESAKFGWKFVRPVGIPA